MAKTISYVERYGTYSGDYMYFIHYENGDMDLYGEDNKPKEVRIWLAKAKGFQFCKSKRGEFYHRFTA